MVLLLASLVAGLCGEYVVTDQAAGGDSSGRRLHGDCLWGERGSSHHWARRALQPTRQPFPRADGHSCLPSSGGEPQHARGVAAQPGLLLDQRVPHRQAGPHQRPHDHRALIPCRSTFPTTTTTTTTTTKTAAAAVASAPFFLILLPFTPQRLHHLLLLLLFFGLSGAPIIHLLSLPASCRPWGRSRPSSHALSPFLSLPPL